MEQRVVIIWVLHKVINCFHRVWFHYNVLNPTIFSKSHSIKYRPKFCFKDGARSHPCCNCFMDKHNTITVNFGDPWTWRRPKGFARTFTIIEDCRTSNSSFNLLRSCIHASWSERCWLSLPLRSTFVRKHNHLSSTRSYPELHQSIETNSKFYYHSCLLDLLSSMYSNHHGRK